MTTRRLLLILVLLLAGSRLAAQSPSRSGPPAGTATPNYVVGPGDRLRINVWNQDNVSGEYVVAGDGSFTFPLIGRVAASGLTLGSLETELRKLLAAGYYNNPQVTASVVEYRSKRVFVMGALRTPGTYPLTGDMSLVEALARAGSTTADAADHLFVIRSAAADGPVLPGESARSEVMRVDLRRLEHGEQSAAVLLQDGDTLYVPRSSTIYVYGEVRRPGAYPIAQDTTVRQALALAGGASEFGAVNRVKILRLIDGREQEMRASLTDRLQPGDTLVIPERLF